jgi:hypothetical protein
MPRIIESSARVKNAKIWRFACRKFETNILIKELCGRSPNVHIHGLYIPSVPTIGLTILLQKKNLDRSQTHECGNWEWGRTLPFLGIQTWDFRCSAQGGDGAGQHAPVLIPISGDNNRVRKRKVVAGHGLTTQYTRTDIRDGISKRLRSPGIDSPSLCSLVSRCVK